VQIEADPVRLRQVLHNLVKNAQEAVAERRDGRVEIATAVVVEEQCRYAEISVEDNGPGFDSESLGQVFDPYVTTKSKGTGLGLAIVKKIVDEHGGLIRADNAAAGGARVVVRLPTADDVPKRARCADAVHKLERKQA
jgi:nitrogen fixation/metabolism regulation signal transduction histidine kinase